MFQKCSKIRDVWPKLQGFWTKFHGFQSTEIQRFQKFPNQNWIPKAVPYCIRNNFWQSSNLAVQNGFISRGSSGLPQLFRVAELGGSEYKFWSFCKPLIVFKVRSFKQKAVFRAPSKFPIWWSGPTARGAGRCPCVATGTHTLCPVPYTSLSLSVYFLLPPSDSLPPFFLSVSTWECVRNPWRPDVSPGARSAPGAREDLKVKV